MQTVEQIIDAFGYGQLALSLGIPAGTVSAWKAPSRNSIPAEYWRDIVRLAEDAGKSGITLATLAEIHARPSPAPAEGRAAA